MCTSVIISVYEHVCLKIRHISIYVWKQNQNNASVSHHWNWLRQIQPTRIKILNLTISVRPSLAPLLPAAFTPSSVLSVHKHKLNLLLMIALLTRRGSIHSRRPATTTGQISWRERVRTKKNKKNKTVRKPVMERHWERIWAIFTLDWIMLWTKWWWTWRRFNSKYLAAKLQREVICLNTVLPSGSDLQRAIDSVTIQIKQYSQICFSYLSHQHHSFFSHFVQMFMVNRRYENTPDGWSNTSWQLMK